MIENIEFNTLDRVEPSVIYLARPGRKLVCALNGVLYDTVSLKINGQNTHELTFDVCNTAYGSLSNGYNLLNEMMLLFCSGIWFKINEAPEIEFDGDYEVKHITAESQEIELLQYDLVGFDVNTGSAGSAEMMIEDNVYVNADGAQIPKENVSFCNKENEKLSLLHLILSHANVPNWKVGYIDELELDDDDSTKTEEIKFLADKVARFSVDSQTVYSFLTQDVANEFRCVFVFDTKTYTINAYAVEHLGADTNIFLTYKNLRNELLATQEEELYTAFRVSGDEDMGIGYANFGTNLIDDISGFTNENYMSPELIDKYQMWNSYRESRREEYMSLSKEYNNYLNDLTELESRVPIDDCQTDWSTFDNDDLLSVKDYYITVINAIYTQYGYANIVMDDEGNPTTEKDEDGFIILKDQYIGDDTLATELSDVMCNGNLKQQMLKDGCWHSYFQYRYNIYESILIEFENRTIADPDDRTDYINAWETDWDLFGISELKIKLISYQERADLLEKNGYGSTYEETSTIEEDYSAQQHKEWLSLVEKIDGCQNALDERQAEYDELKKEQDAVQDQRNNLVSDIDITNHSFQFTDEEINIIKSLYKYTDYQNENFYVSQYATPDEEVEEQYRLYLDAKDALYAKSHPQYTYRDSIDNIYALPEFNNFQKQLQIYDFIHVEVSDGYYEKLRLISITYNPCMLENNMEIEFTSMIQYSAKRNDYAQLLNQQNKDAKNKILGISGSTNDLEYNIDSSVIKTILNSLAFGTAISDATQNAIIISTGRFEGLLTGELTSEKIATKLLEADQAVIDELSSKFITADNIVSTVIESDEIRSAIIEAAEGRFQSLMTEYIDADYINSKVIIAESAIIGKISVADLKAHNTTSDLITLISTETGDPTIAFKDSTQQFYDSEGNVRVQIGQDANGDFNFIVRGADGVTAIYDENGITKDAIADGLIINNMISDGTISEDKLGFQIIKPNEHGGIDIEQIYDGTGELWGVKVESTMQSIETDMKDLADKVENNVTYDMQISTSNGRVFNHGIVDTIATVHLYQGGIEITDDYDDSCFIWTRESSDTSGDTYWNEQHSSGSKTLYITRDDVLYGASFKCAFILEGTTMATTS